MGAHRQETAADGADDLAHLALGLVWVAEELRRDLQGPMRRIGGAKRLWEARSDDLRRVFARTPDVATEFVRARDAFRAATARAELERETAWFEAVDPQEAHTWLRATPDPPVGLLGLGRTIHDITSSGRPRVAIVGSRHPTSFGLQYSADLAAGLGSRGAVIVSGLAIGVDAAAHRGALTAGAETVAVLGCGVGVDHPRTNSGLRRQIIDAGGSVMSEYWLSATPARWTFPARNRIVAALADAVVVTEASARSGALITADFALDLGRPVLAVPGRPGSATSAGCHSLLRAGAAFCETVDDVVAELPDSLWADGADGVRARVPDGLGGRIHGLLSGQPLSLPEITARLDHPAAAVATSLTEMELAGLVVGIDGNRYAVRVA